MNDGTHTYYYDGENRIIQVGGTLGNCSSATQCYSYDALGRRSEKMGTAWIDRIFDLSDRPVALASATGGVAAYIYLRGAFVTHYK